MRRILVLGRSDDLCCQLVGDALIQTDHDVLILHEDRLFPQLQFMWSPQDEITRGVIVYAERRIGFSEIDGILVRSYGVPVLPEDYDTKDSQYISAEWHALLVAWLWQMPCPVINRVRPNLWYKMHLNVAGLRALVPGVQLRLPRTCVTTRTDHARAFVQRLPGPVWYGPLTQPSRYLIRSTDHLTQLLKLDGVLPFHLTERVDGQQLEAYVVGDDVVLVDTDGVADMSAPASIHTPCVEIGRALGLVFYRLSLIKAARGAWYCLGLERMPQLHACDTAAKHRIANALARVLVAGGVEV